MMSRGHLRAVTGSRFFAAMAVIAFHFAAYNSSSLPWFLSKIIIHGNVAVNFFFILSGFVLAYNYVDSKIEAQSFWWSRFARVYPLYLLALTINVPFFIEQLQGWSYSSALTLGRRFAIETLLLQSWAPLEGKNINGPGWSISTEALFYLIFPLVAVYLSRFSKRKIMISVAVTWIIALSVQIPLLFLRWSIADSPNNTTFSDFIAYFPLLHLPGFLIGAAAGTLFQRKYRFRLGDLTVAQKTLFDLALLLFCGVLIITADPSSSLMSQAFIAPFLALVIISLACDGSLVTRFLASRPVVLLGEISYAIYILQFPVSNYLRWLIRAAGFSSYGTIFYTIGYIPTIIGISFLSYYLVEVPARKKIVQFVRTKRDGVRRAQESRSAG